MIKGLIPFFFSNIFITHQAVRGEQEPIRALDFSISPFLGGLENIYLQGSYLRSCTSKIAILKIAMKIAVLKIAILHAVLKMKICIEDEYLQDSYLHRCTSTTAILKIAV